MRPAFVGNDVIDLGHPRTEGRSSHERFVARVFDDDEQAAIRTSSEPDLELWSRWTAKEAGFKVVSKLLGKPPTFVHRRFEVRWSTSGSARAAGAAGTVIRKGRVGYEGHVVGVTVTRFPDHLHAVAFAPAPRGVAHVRIESRVARVDRPNGAWSGSLEELTARFSERERDAVYSRESAAVRVGARRDLAERLGVVEERLEIVCAPGRPGQRPPRVFQDGKPSDADVSLSHDGRWIAWVTCIPDRGGGAS